MSVLVYLLLAVPLHLAQLGVHEVLHRLYLRPHLLLGGLQLVLQLADQRLAAAAVQRGLGPQEAPGEGQHQTGSSPQFRPRCG